MLNQETAKAARTDSGYILRAPRRMRVADAVAQYMRVPMGPGIQSRGIRWWHRMLLSR
ncbi:DNA packaging protein of prophage (terminase large subunit) [Escherichia coli]|nr:DNA packaging protein of prophage (terminase large subunit) [Escherichia coli]